MSLAKKIPNQLVATLVAGVLLLATAACTSTTESSTASGADTTVQADEAETSESSAEQEQADTATSVDCEETTALFVTGESANPDLPDPEVAATCDGDTITVVSNGVPDFTYIGTSPGSPDGREFIHEFPAEVEMADEVTAVPYIGPIGVTLNGISVYGPTEGTGGDVDSFPGIISACGSHNGPGGFHTHKILATDETDCWFTPEEVAEEPQLVGYMFDGIPLYTGIDQYTSSWQLTDETLFATDTWAAHSYVEGSGDLDECNGLTDADGNYAYYTTEEFPYLIGCFAGEVVLEGPGGGEGGEDGEERPERPEGEDGEERPERPEVEEGEDRPERPEVEEGEDRPERPEVEEGEDRPELPEDDEGEEGEEVPPPEEPATDSDQ